MIFFSLLHYTMCRGVITQLKGDELPRPLRPPVRKSNKAKYYYIFSIWQSVSPYPKTKHFISTVKQFVSPYLLSCLLDSSFPGGTRPLWYRLWG